MKNFILASASARRQDFLKQLGYDFDIIVADIDESAKKAEKPKDYVKRLAIEKAQKVAQNNPNSNILAADTICSMGRKIYGKPKDKEQAGLFLKDFSGNNHRIYTGICLITKNGEIKAKVVETRVKFKNLSNKEIEKHISLEDNWKGYAGGYMFQMTSGQRLIKSINGSPSSIIGLPLVETENLLKQI